MVTEGQKAPDFELKVGEEEVITLSAFLGKKVVLYFYPRDATPGCTKQACGFRDQYPVIQEQAVLIGVSGDSLASHAKFAKKHALPFYLATDPDYEVARRYGAFGLKTSFGKTTEGILRKTFLINEEGVITKVFEKVKVDGHASDVLAYL